MLLETVKAHLGPNSAENERISAFAEQAASELTMKGVRLTKSERFWKKIRWD